MEYIQTILFQVTSASLEQASRAGGLIPELDEHRDYLKGQPGFVDMRITRSINPEGNVLLLVETRWSSDDSLVRYETNEPNVAAIVRKHQDIIVADSIQVLDMEALRTESSWAPAEAAEKGRERVILPIMIPVGILAFALLVIYGLSRIYLELSSTGATALAAGVAIAVLLSAGYFASNVKAPAWQIGGVLMVAVAALVGGTIWALVEDDDAAGEGNEPAVGNEEPTPDPGPGGSGETLITMGDNFFEVGGERAPAIPIAAGEAVTLNITNGGVAVHNMQVNGTDNTFDIAICKPGDASTACSDPGVISGGAEATITIQIDSAGTYNFRCDFHPTEMVGTLVVQ